MSLIATNCDKKMPQTCGTDTYVCEKDLACGSEQLNLSPYALEISWDVNRLFQ